MQLNPVPDLDFLTARLHGRLSRVAAGVRLDGLCRLPGATELSRIIHPEAEFHAMADFQRRLARDLFREISSCRCLMPGRGADLLNWMLVRFQVENIKILLRALVRKIQLEGPEEFLFAIPEELRLDELRLRNARSVADFAAALPRGSPRDSLLRELPTLSGSPNLLVLEAALDRGYFEELLMRGQRLGAADRDWVQPVLKQEVDTFHLLLALRGRFNHGLAADVLAGLHVAGSEISGRRFASMLAAGDILAVARLAVHRVIDSLPSVGKSGSAKASLDIATVEALAWERWVHCCVRALRRNPLGMGTVIGYLGIRRVEIANLISLSEGLRVGIAPESLRARLHPRRTGEADYV